MTIEIYKNSLVSLEEAQGYFEERFDSDKWFTLEEADKEKLLITASKRVSMFEYVGEKADEAQVLAFPRDYAMPLEIKDAVCEEAIVLAQRAGTVHESNQKLGIQSISLGTGSISYEASPVGEEAKILVSEAARYLVKKWVKKGFQFSC